MFSFTPLKGLEMSNFESTSTATLIQEFASSPLTKCILCGESFLPTYTYPVCVDVGAILDLGSYQLERIGNVCKSCFVPSLT